MEKKVDLEASATNNIESEVSTEWDLDDADITLDEDADVLEIIDLLEDTSESLFDHTEKETLRMMQRGPRIAWPKQLGDWVSVTVDGVLKKIKCNCERCNRSGKCDWVAVMEVIQFGVRPSTDDLYVDEGIGWVQTVVRARSALKLGNVRMQ